MKHFKIQLLFNNPKRTDSRNSKPKKITSLIPVCKYAKSTPWGACTRYEMVTIELHEMVAGSDFFQKISVTSAL